MTPTPNEAVSAAWREAAVEFGLSVTAPVTVELSPGQSATFEALVRDFGSAAGTLVTTTDRMELWRLVDAKRYHCSALNPLHYSVFEREVFLEALRDWGWMGKGSPPEYLSPAARRDLW